MIIPPRLYMLIIDESIWFVIKLGFIKKQILLLRVMYCLSNQHNESKEWRQENNISELAICHSNAIFIQNPTTVTNQTMELYCILLPFTLPCRTTWQNRILTIIPKMSVHMPIQFMVKCYYIQQGFLQHAGCDVR